VSRFTAVVEPDPPSLFCAECRKWGRATTAEVVRVGWRLWVCPGCRPATRPPEEPGSGRNAILSPLCVETPPLVVVPKKLVHHRRDTRKIEARRSTRRGRAGKITLARLGGRG